MRTFTVALFFLFMGSYTMMAQSVQSVALSPEFKIVLDAVPKTGTVLQFDISQFNFENEAKAKRVIAGYARRDIKVDFAAQTATLTLPENMLNGNTNLSQVNRMLARMGKGIQFRLENFN